MDNICSQGIKAVIAESYERIHRSNLVGMGIIPLQYLDGQTADTLALTGKETYSINIPDNLTAGQNVEVKVGRNLMYYNHPPPPPHTHTHIGNIPTLTIFLDGRQNVKVKVGKVLMLDFFPVVHCNNPPHQTKTACPPTNNQLLQ